MKEQNKNGEISSEFMRSDNDDGDRATMTIDDDFISLQSYTERNLYFLRKYGTLEGLYSD